MNRFLSRIPGQRLLPPWEDRVRLRNLRAALLDRYRVRSILKNPRIDNLVLYANSFCNARCAMCDVGSGSRTGIANALIDTPRFLSTTLLTKILQDELIAQRRISINFLMTEPLLAPALPELLRLCKERNHTVMLTTNGYLLARRAHEIAGLVDGVQVSLDGPEEIHDAIRGPGFHAAAIAGIRALRELDEKVAIVINYTISNLNDSCLFDFLQQVESAGVRIDMVKYQLLDFVSEQMQAAQNASFPDIPQSTSSLHGGIDVRKVDTIELSRQLELVRRFRRTSVREVGFKPPLSSVQSLQAYFDPQGDPVPGADRCITPWVALAVNTAGKAFWHMRCFNEYLLGDVNNENLRGIFYGERAEYFRKRLLGSGRCFPACARCCGVMPLR
jgi:molybdenum cofactor biosynthesis enzyme MoaA